jgi:sec-independent protein translocase protein TatA
MFGTWELLLILLIVVIVFGAKRIPEVMGGLGKGIRSFKKAMDTEDEPKPEIQQNPPPSINSQSQAQPSNHEAGSQTRIEPK